MQNLSLCMTIGREGSAPRLASDINGRRNRVEMTR